jgi:hypothetical protein
MQTIISNASQLGTNDRVSSKPQRSARAMSIEKTPNSPRAAKHSKHVRNMAVRKSFRNWLTASQRAKTLRLRGFYVSVPAPRLGHPQFILITSKSDNLIQ